ncbi:MAG TPA: alpha/beta hydrolase [Thermoanaerobaculia bacterium]|nr:alpha/beta hydrolase [Thermoanaerobaculia bacterium]
MQLHFDAEGDGPLVVLLHGFPESRRAWKHQLPALGRAGFRAVAPDLRGYADSPKPQGVEAYVMTEVVADVVELIESMSSVPVVVVGHDWGAIVAWNLAMIRPDLVRKLVILNVPHPAAIKRELQRSTRQKLKLLYQIAFQLPLLPELFMKIFGRFLLHRTGRFTREETAAYKREWRDSLKTMLNYYRAIPKSRGLMRKLLRRIDVPTMILWGEREPVFLPAALEDLGEWVSNVRIERIADAGHFLPMDAPEEVTRLLIDFASTPATAPPPTS